MDLGNQTLFNELILAGFSQDFQTMVLLFVMFCLMYSLTILENSLLLYVVIISPQMHTHMYYFLCNLSFLDLFYSSCSIPKLLLDVFSKRRRISITGCLVQMNTGLFLGTTECLLLAVMAYDRYIAICFPLHYTIYMNWKTCKIITVIMWSGSFVTATVPTISKPLVFCKQNRMDHFACEILALLELACGDVTFHKTTLFIESLFMLLVPLIFIVVSYIRIIISVLKIHSTGGRSRAFSTCASHLIVVFMFYGTSMTTYMGQTKRSSSLKYIALIYSVMTPGLNPLIYSLRNNDVKEAFKKILTKYSA